MKLNVKSLFMAVIALLLVAARPAKYEIGDTVGDFKLKNVDGKSVSLSDYKAQKGVIIVFDCNTCPISKAYNGRIQALNKKYKSQGFPVITINANDPETSAGDSFEAMVSMAKKNKYDFPYLVDENQEVAKSFGATNTPHVFVVARSGNEFKLVYIGAIDNNTRDADRADKKYVEEAVDALLAGKEVPTSKTKAIGCGIKWKNV